MRYHGFWGRALRHPSFMCGAVLVVLLILTALVSFIWTPFDPDAQAIRDKLQLPNALHWLGTDHLGRDIASRLMVGARISIAVGIVAVGIGMVFGVMLGALAATRGGWADELLSRFSDLVFAFPALLLAILLTAIYGPGAVNAIVAIGVFNIPVFARVTRGAALQAWGRDYTRAALALGRGPVAVTIHHVLPNIVGILVVQGTIQFAIAILVEAGLSFLGLGVQPPAASWGRMLTESQTYAQVQVLQGFAPTIAIFPGLAIFFSVLGLNLLGDGLRDVLDPRLRIARGGVPAAMAATSAPEPGGEDGPAG